MQKRQVLFGKKIQKADIFFTFLKNFSNQRNHEIPDFKSDTLRIRRFFFNFFIGDSSPNKPCNWTPCWQRPGFSAPAAFQEWLRRLVGSRSWTSEGLWEWRWPSSQGSTIPDGSQRWTGTSGCSSRNCKKGRMRIEEKQGE